MTDMLYVPETVLEACVPFTVTEKEALSEVKWGIPLKVAELGVVATVSHAGKPLMFQESASAGFVEETFTVVEYGMFIVAAGNAPKAGDSVIRGAIENV